MATIPELIVQWREQKLKGSGLLRAVVSHSTWTVPISDNAAAHVVADGSLPAVQIHAHSDGQKWLLIFSSSQTWDVYAKANSIPAGQHTLTTTGTWIFQNDFSDLDRIWIDPFNPDDIFYERSQFGLLREMAEAVQVEEALLGLRQGNAPPNALQHVRAFKNYYLIVKLADGKTALVIAPDSKGRKLAAVFTTTEALEIFMQEIKEAFGAVELRLLHYDGIHLFQMIQGMSMDGFVFNCSGPATPVAFALKAATVFLEG
jgi:hypothetical protein